jgi:cell division protein FtsN
VAEEPRQRVVLSAQNAPAQPAAKARVTQSTKSVPTETAPATGGRLFVQVGSFGVSANADGASARLAGLGLPVARSNGRIGGKPVQVVLAGPFGSAAEAQAALRAARGAGFGDAFVR